MSQALDGEAAERFRREFPVLRRWVYLDHATMAPLPRRVVGAMARFLAERAERGSLVLPRWVERVEEVRRKAAAFIGARPEEVAFVKNTTEGILLAAESIDWRPGDNVVTVRGEFPANVYPWLALRGRGVAVRFAVPDEAGRVTVEGIMGRVDGRTRLVAVSHVQFSTGFRIDVESLGAACARAGVPLLVDAAQSLGALRVDAGRWGAAFLAANSGKWLLGPGGIGVFYCRRDLLDRLVPANVGWRSVRAALHDFNYPFDLRPDAARFEEGSWNLPGLAGLEAALDLLDEAGPEAVERRVLALADSLARLLADMGWEVASPRGPGEGSGIVCFRVPGRPAAAVVEGLRAAGIAVSAAAGAVRVSPHFYNTAADLERLAQALLRLLR